MNEEQLRQLIIDTLLNLDQPGITNYTIKYATNSAIEIANLRGLLTSTDNTSKFWCSVHNKECSVDPSVADKVMWDKNEPYGAVKKEDLDPENKVHSYDCDYCQEKGPCDC